MRSALGVWLLCGFAACASVAGTPPERAADFAPEPRAVPLFHGTTGGVATWDELVEACARAEVVFLGENHGHPLGLASAAALFEDVVARAPKAALALEFIERDEQSRLDDYLSGVADLETFERRAARTTGNFPPGHRAMVECAKEHGRRVHAANAPRQYVRIANREGYERLAQLSAEQQRMFRIPRELFGGRYRDDFDRVMTPKERDPAAADERERLDRVYRSQQMWDWTMAESLYLALGLGDAPVVLVVGRFHTDFTGGTPQAVEALRPGTRWVIVSFVDRASDALAEADLNRADFVAYVGASPRPD